MYRQENQSLPSLRRLPLPVGIYNRPSSRTRFGQRQIPWPHLKTQVAVLLLRLRRALQWGLDPLRGRNGSAANSAGSLCVPRLPNAPPPVRAPISPRAPPRLCVPSAVRPPSAIHPGRATLLRACRRPFFLEKRTKNRACSLRSQMPPTMAPPPGFNAAAPNTKRPALLRHAQRRQLLPRKRRKPYFKPRKVYTTSLSLSAHSRSDSRCCHVMFPPCASSRRVSRPSCPVMPRCHAFALTSPC